MNKFLEELKRRNVIKSTIAYLVVAWILLQVFTVLLPIVNVADWGLKIVTLILFLKNWTRIIPGSTVCRKDSSRLMIKCDNVI